ncbi:MAG TPA: orotidine 5'-phosphate decarboxylase [Candidatus Nanoarchaeia archaeon]|nr:orotidine 5'-phosphate decarboxylase [Candidatus Nanoarchaeia archaeon]
MRFSDKWADAVRKKNSLLCVGLDPEDRDDKIQWCKDIITQVAPYAAAVKINRNYVKDLSRGELQTLTGIIHQYGMLAIDDSKLTDIGSTNEKGFHHPHVEGFDAVTYAPFPGNVSEAVGQAHARDLGIIVLVLMSNPEYEVMKNAQINGKPAYMYFAEQSRDADAIVIGAPSTKNHLTLDEIKAVKSIIPDRCVLVPGIGAQGGEAKSLIDLFGDKTIINVGRAIIYANNPADEARKYRDMLNEMRKT